MNVPTLGKRLVILPSYNSGPLLTRTLAAVAAVWPDVRVVIDGSTDGSAAAARAAEKGRVIECPTNGGKGAAVLHAFRAAAAAGFDHALVMDADGQHPVGCVHEFTQLSERHPGCLIAGVPVFGPDAPLERVNGRKVGNTLATIETLGRGAKDSLFGFRVYPIAPSIAVMESTRGGRRFDFDTVLAVRLAWAGVPTINRSVPVFYPAREKGGVTHFRYLRDNLLLARTHVGLFLRLPMRIPRLLSLPCP